MPKPTLSPARQRRKTVDTTFTTLLSDLKETAKEDHEVTARLHDFETRLTNMEKSLQDRMNNIQNQLNTLQNLFFTIQNYCHRSAVKTENKIQLKP